MIGEKSKRFHFNKEELQFLLVDVIEGDFWDHINLDPEREKEENPNV